MKTVFGDHTKNYLCGRKYSQKLGVIRAKIFRIPKNLPAPTPMTSLHKHESFESIRKF